LYKAGFCKEIRPQEIFFPLNGPQGQNHAAGEDYDDCDDQPFVEGAHHWLSLRWIVVSYPISHYSAGFFERNLNGFF
jgi:hypothetical protein